MFNNFYIFVYNNTYYIKGKLLGNGFDTKINVFSYEKLLKTYLSWGPKWVLISWSRVWVLPCWSSEYSLIEHDFTITAIIYILILHGTICSTVMAWFISTFKVSVYLQSVGLLATRTLCNTLNLRLQFEEEEGTKVLCLHYTYIYEMYLLCRILNILW